MMKRGRDNTAQRFLDLDARVADDDDEENDEDDEYGEPVVNRA